MLDQLQLVAYSLVISSLTLITLCVNVCACASACVYVRACCMRAYVCMCVCVCVRACMLVCSRGFAVSSLLLSATCKITALH